MQRLSKQVGISLVEILIGMAIGIAALTAVASVLGYGIGVNANLLSSSRVNEESSNILSLIQRDIRRAGYSGDTLAMLEDPEANPSPFADTIVLSAYPDETANSCILFSYDANNNGTIETGINGESFGYRLKDNVAEIRQGDLTCIDEGWLALSDEDVVLINGLTFTLSQTFEGGVPTTAITINLLAELASDSDVSRQFTTEVLVRNYDG